MGAMPIPRTQYATLTEGDIADIICGDQVTVNVGVVGHNVIFVKLSLKIDPTKEEQRRQDEKDKKIKVMVEAIKRVMK